MAEEEADAALLRAQGIMLPDKLGSTSDNGGGGGGSLGSGGGGDGFLGVGDRYVMLDYRCSPRHQPHAHSHFLS